MHHLRPLIGRLNGCRVLVVGDLMLEGRGAGAHPTASAVLSDIVDIARGNFRPARKFEGQEIIAKAGSVLGHDDDEPVTTPYDNCVLVMPSSNRPLRAGVTVVRLGRLV